MKITKEFIVRKVVDECVLIPVGETALHFNGLISLNPVAEVIWNKLQQETTREELLAAILDEFDVPQEQAAADLDEFLDLLRKNELMA